MLELSKSQKGLLQSKQLITQKRVLADVLESVTDGHIEAAYTLQYWPTVDIVRELEIRIDTKK